jgi:hypothetical protein
MLTNAQLREAAADLVAAVGKFGKDLARYEELPPLKIAVGLVQIDKLHHALQALAKATLAGADTIPGRERRGEQARFAGRDPEHDRDGD